MKKLINTLIFTISSIFLTSCSGPVEDYSNKETLIIGTSADNPPYEFVKDGEIVGLDIDVIKSIGESLNKKIVIKNMDFPGLIPSLTTGNIDAVIAGITVTEERKKKVDFSRGYVSTSMEVMFLEKNNFNKIEDLKDKIIGVQSGTTWEMYAKSQKERFPTMKITSLPNNLVLIEALKNENIDAIIMEQVQIIKFKNKVENLASFILPDTKGEFAIATQKNSGLAEIFNKAIDKLQLEGKLYPIKTKWLSN